MAVAARRKVTHGSVMLLHNGTVIVLPGRRARMHPGVGGRNDGEEIVAGYRVGADAARIGVDLCSVLDDLLRSRGYEGVRRPRVLLRRRRWRVKVNPVLHGGHSRTTPINRYPISRARKLVHVMGRRRWRR